MSESADRAGGGESTPAPLDSSVGGRDIRSVARAIAITVASFVMIVCGAYELNKSGCPPIVYAPKTLNQSFFA